jgi:hypothetical protein
MPVIKVTLIGTMVRMARIRIHAIVYRDVTFITILRPKAPVMVWTGVHNGFRRFDQCLAVNRLITSSVGIVIQETVAVRELVSIDVGLIRIDVVDGE